MIKISQNGFAVLGIIAIVLITAILGGGGYLLTSRQPSQKAEKSIVEEEFSGEERSLTAQKTEKGTAKPAETEGEKRSPQKNEEVSATKSTVKIFLIALDDQGKFGKLVGCGDSVVSVERTITSTDQISIKEALNDLFSVKDQYVADPGFHNALSGSDLKVNNVIINNDSALVYLSGKYSLAGACDNPRFKAQIEETILQFPSIKQTSVFINNIPLDKILSGQGT